MEFAIDGVHYRTTRLSAMDAFHVARRFSMAIFMLAQLKERTPDAMARSLVASSSGIPQNDADFVMSKCMATCSRQVTGGAYAPLAASTGDLMYNDLSLMTLMKILYYVLEDNSLISFFTIPPSATEVESPTTIPS